MALENLCSSLMHTTKETNTQSEGSRCVMEEISVTYSSTRAKDGKAKEALETFAPIYESSEARPWLKLMAGLLMAFFNLIEKKYEISSKLIPESSKMFELLTKEDRKDLVNAIIILWMVQHDVKNLEDIVREGIKLPIDSQNFGITFNMMGQNGNKYSVGVGVGVKLNARESDEVTIN